MVEPGLEGTSGLQRLKLRCSTWLSLLPCTSIITSSEVMSAWHRQFGVPGSKLHVIPNGVDTSKFHPPANVGDRELLRTRYQLPVGAIVGLLAGNLIPRKRPHLVVNAWRKLRQKFPDAVLLLVGSAKRPTIGSNQEGAEIVAYQEQLFSAIAAQDPHVRWLGERVDMPDIYRAVDFFAFPTEQEGFGNVLLEALASGLPVLSSRFRGFPADELAGAVQVVEEDSEDAWARAMEGLAMDAGQRVSLGSSGISLVGQRFKLEKILDQLCGVYRHSLNG